MKVMVIHNNDDTGKQLAGRIKAMHDNVTELEAVWPTFFQAVHQPHTVGSFHRPPEEQPDLIIVEASSNPSAGREVAGYLGETGFTRHIPVWIVNHPEAEAYKAKRRAPQAELMTTGQLEQRLVDLIGPSEKKADQPVA